MWSHSKVDFFRHWISKEEFLYPWSLPKYTKSISLYPYCCQDTHDAHGIVYPSVSFLDQCFKLTKFTENFVSFYVCYTFLFVNVNVIVAIDVIKNPLLLSMESFNIIFIIFLDVSFFNEFCD
jgi:hypothetical protein